MKLRLLISQQALYVPQGAAQFHCHSRKKRKSIKQYPKYMNNRGNKIPRQMAKFDIPILFLLFCLFVRGARSQTVYDITKYGAKDNADGTKVI